MKIQRAIFFVKCSEGRISASFWNYLWSNRERIYVKETAIWRISRTSRSKFDTKSLWRISTFGKKQQKKCFISGKMKILREFKEPENEDKDLETRFHIIFVKLWSVSVKKNPRRGRCHYEGWSSYRILKSFWRINILFWKKTENVMCLQIKLMSCHLSMTLAGSKCISFHIGNS